MTIILLALVGFEITQVLTDVRAAIGLKAK
jgi:hypothetical protein